MKYYDLVVLWFVFVHYKYIQPNNIKVWCVMMSSGGLPRL